MKSSPQKCAFEEAIIILVVGLSRFFNGRWFSIEDLQALFVAGGIQNELTCDHIRLAIKSRNYGRLVENRFGKKSTRFFRCCKSIKSITPKETIGAEIPRIRRRHFLGSENEDQVSIIELYFKNTVLGKHGCGETASMPGQEQLTPTALSPIVVLPSMTITPGKEVTPSCHGSSPSKKQRKQIQTAITPVAKISFRPPSKVTPHKEEHTVSQSCRGWTGSHYESLFRQSLTECSYSAEIAARPSHVFGLSSVYASLKDASELIFCYEAEKGFKLRSKSCAGMINVADNTNRRSILCCFCSPLVKTVSSAANSASKPLMISPTMQASKANFAKLSPDGCVAFLKQVRKKKDQELRNERRCRTRLQKLMDKGMSPINDDSTLSSVTQILEAVAPYIEKTFGKDSERATIWKEALRKLVKNEGELDGPGYHDTVLKYALSKLPKVSKATFESIQNLLFLPSRRHVQRISAKLVSGEEGMEDGPRRTACKTMMRVAKENGWVDDALDMVVTFDGMIMRGCLLLSGKKETKNKLLGCHLLESDSVIEKCFDDYVRKISAASLEQDTFESSLGEALTMNKEHLVYYAKALKPGVDLCFIIAAYNVPSTQAHQISSHVYENILVLEENNFNVRVLCADNAQCNESYFHSKGSMKASEFIPQEVLNKHGLSGDFIMALQHPVNLQPIFIISDPPHALKKVGSSLEHRGLHWEGSEMTMKMLFDVHEAINAHQGEGCLSANPKFGVSDFFGNRFLAMNVKRSAKIFSGTMAGMVTQVCNEPEKYPLATCPPGFFVRSLAF